MKKAQEKWEVSLPKCIKACSKENVRNKEAYFLSLRLKLLTHVEYPG